jgi:WD40 repeat protein
MSTSNNRLWLWVIGGVAAASLLVGLGAVVVVGGVAFFWLGRSAENDAPEVAAARAAEQALEAEVELPDPAPRMLSEAAAPPGLRDPLAGADGSVKLSLRTKPDEAGPRPESHPPVESPKPPAPTESPTPVSLPAAELPKIAPFLSSAPTPEFLPGLSLNAEATLRSMLSVPAPGRGLAFSPDGGMLAVSAGNQVLLWDAATGSPAGTLKGHRSHVMKICFSRDGARLATASHDNSVGVWDPKAARALAKLDGHAKQAHVVAYSPVSEVLASGGFDGVLNLWNVAQGKPATALTHGETEVTALAYSPDGSMLASGGRDGTLVFWNAATGEKLATQSVHASAVNQLLFSRDGRFAVAAGADQKTKYISTRAPYEAAGELTGHRGGVSSIAIHPSGRLLATAGGSDGRIMLWDAVLGDELGSFPAHEGGVRAIEFSPNGAMLVTCADDRTVKLWDVKLTAWSLPPVPVAFRDAAAPPRVGDDAIEELGSDDSPLDVRDEDDPIIAAHAASRDSTRLFRSGVGVWPFARNAKQGTFGEYCSTLELGKPTGGPEVIRSLSPWTFDPAGNAVAKCYLKIAQSGEYDFAR